ncbi:MAG: ABC transporter permease subunit, partial [Actinomycetota bacterium]
MAEEPRVDKETGVVIATDTEEVRVIEISGPPTRRLPPREWLRENLFSTWYNTVLTIALSILVAWLLYRIGRFVLVTGRWEVIRRNITLFLVERFPRDMLWRPWAAAYVLAAAVGVFTGATAAVRLRVAEERGRVREPRSIAAIVRRATPLILFAVVFLSLSSGALPILLVLGIVGFGVGAWWLATRLPRRFLRWRFAFLAAGVFAMLEVVMEGDGVGWENWGGLMLTIFLAVGGILLSFPFGVLLALGRRSSLPAIRALSVAYIELIRGVPLITLLFMGRFVLGFFVPARFPKP